MPMHNTSTPKSATKISDNMPQPSGPRASTLAFLKQFARAYTYIPGMKPSMLAGVIAN